MAADSERNFSGKHLVVFGCGYVGTFVATQAIARGLRVTALTRNAAAANLLRESGIETVVADLADADWHDAVPAAPDFAVDCVSSGGGDVENYRRSYVDGMKSITTWARQRGALGTLVYTSSTSVYPQGDGSRVDETASTRGVGERGELLLEAERALQQSREACRRWFILRLAGIYGPGRHRLLEQVRGGEVAGVGTHRLNLVHRDDIAAAIWACVEAPPTIANEIFNLADDAPAAKSEVAAWLASRLGLSAPRFSGAGLPTREAQETTARETRATARRAVTPDRIIVNTKIRTALGWRPRYPSYREGYESLLSR